MKTGKQRAFSPWVFAAIVAILICGVVFIGCGDGNETASVTADYGVVTGVTLDRSTLGMGIGDTEQLTATVAPSSVSATDKTVTWKSTNKAVATVDDEGNVTAVDVGTAKITVTTKNGKQASCDVTVDNVSVDDISLTLDFETLSLEVRETGQLSVTILPVEASNRTIDWLSDNPDVAIVDNSGLVTAKAVGTANIIVMTRRGGKMATCEVTVDPASVTSVTLNKATLTLGVGDDEQLTATVLPDYAGDKTVTWESSDPTKATVDEDGVVIGVTVCDTDETVIITVTTNNGGFTDTCEVTVVPPIAVTSMTLPTTFYVAVGGRKTLTPTFLPANASKINKVGTWTVSSSTPAGVVTVDQNGVVSGLITGTATITMTLNTDPTKTGSCTVTVDLGMLENMVIIPDGTFMMGSPTTELGHYDYYDPSWTDETQHEVTLTKGFYMAKYQITHSQFVEVMEFNPSEFVYYGERPIDYGMDFPNWNDCPIDCPTWYEAIEYCNKLSEWEGFTPAYTITGATVTCNWDANGYRLPTEAEWEFACRAETTGPFNTGKDTIISGLPGVGGEANFDGDWAPYNGAEAGDYLGCPIPVGSYEPNDYGLYDMHGNMDEWCWDWYDEDYYETSPQTDPKGPDSSTGSKVIRGGSFWSGGEELRSAYRDSAGPRSQWWIIGFRLVRNLPSEPDERISRAAKTIEQNGTAQQERVIPQGIDIPQGIQTFEKNSAVKPKIFRKKGE
jgi:uncharacterized protein YjdB